MYKYLFIVLCITFLNAQQITFKIKNVSPFAITVLGRPQVVRYVNDVAIPYRNAVLKPLATIESGKILTITIDLVQEYKSAEKRDIVTYVEGQLLQLATTEGSFVKGFDTITLTQDATFVVSEATAELSAKMSRVDLQKTSEKRLKASRQ